MCLCVVDIILYCLLCGRPHPFFRQYSGNYMAIYINLSAWVGWSRFSSGFQLLPWRGDTSCANKMMVWDGVPFKKL